MRLGDADKLPAKTPMRFHALRRWQSSQRTAEQQRTCEAYRGATQEHAPEKACEGPDEEPRTLKQGQIPYIHRSASERDIFHALPG
jgi:hypothetical protein